MNKRPPRYKQKVYRDKTNGQNFSIDWREIFEISLPDSYIERQILSLSATVDGLGPEAAKELLTALAVFMANNKDAPEVKEFLKRLGDSNYD